MSSRVKRLLHAFSVWFTLVTVTTPSLAGPGSRDDVPAPVRTGMRVGRSLDRALRASKHEPHAPLRSANQGSLVPRSVVAKRSLPARDWVKAPAIVDYAPPSDVFAVSDLHGRYDQAFELLRANGLLRGSVDAPRSVAWTGGRSTLVIVGDSINKGNGSIAIVDMLRQLQADAEKKGGKVIVTLGNHEAHFVHAPFSERSLRDGTDGRVGFGHELLRSGLSPKLVANGADAEGRGTWMRELPFAAKVGDYFFVHSGNTRGMDRATLSAAIERAVAEGGFGHPELIGADATSVLAADDWKLTASEARANAAKLGAKHIVMGHIPNALDAHGDIARSIDGALIKLDTGLGNGDGPARMLHIRTKGARRQVDTVGVRAGLRRQAPASAAAP